MSRTLQHKSRRFGFAFSVGLHVGLLLALVWGFPKLVRRLDRSGRDDRPLEIVQVPPTGSVPVTLSEPAYAPFQEAVVVPLAPDTVKTAEETPRPSERRSRPRTVQRQTNRVVRAAPGPHAPEEEAKPVDPEQIMRLVMADIPATGGALQPAGENDPAVAAYYDRVFRVMQASWIQPQGAGAGLRAEAGITVGPDGRITAHRMLTGSQSPAMDASIARVLESVREFPPPPAGFGAPREIIVAFILEG